MPLKSKESISLVLLFYNEEGNIVSVVEGVRDALDKAGYNFQLILVNNGSSDNTPELIDELTLSDGRLKSVTVEVNRGYGWGVISGLNSADGEWIGYMDGDGQISPASLLRVMRWIDSDYDMIKARRALRLDGFVRRWISNIYVMSFCLLFNVPFYDVNAKPRIFKRSWLDFLQLKSTDWFIDAEMIAKAGKLDLRIKEIPVVFRERDAGKSSVNFRAILQFIKNIFTYRFGKYLKDWEQRLRQN
jgi:glycosyltransferase involved in cell wall biosynthesis